MCSSPRTAPTSALPFPGGPIAPPGVLHIERKRFLWDQRLYERICLVNYSRDEVIIPLTFEFDSDFRDMFEVRGLTRAKRGYRHAPDIGGRSVTFRYDGLDGVERTSVITFSDPPGRLSGNRAEYYYPLGPEGRLELYIEIGLEPGPTPTRERFRSGAARARFAMRARRRKGARLRTSGRLFSQWIEKSRADLALLTTEMDTGPYPYAGIPWFSTAFGRDGILTAWQVLWCDPSPAKGVLTYLAKHQATEVSAFRDSAPGKIQHETRRGEMANLGEVPFARYYGGVDTTPLFVALAGAYAERTDDMALIEALWPSLCAAVGWIETYGDTDGDGLIDYARGAESGLANQGWKDSQDSVFHADGRFATGPIALVEVQGYAFAAYQAMAGLAKRRGDEDAAAAGWPRPSASARRSSSVSGWRRKASTPSRSTAQASSAACALQPRPPAVRQARGAAAGAQGGRTPAVAPVQLRLGRAHPGGWRGALQPDELPQRLGLAARHGDRHPGAPHYGERDGVVALMAAMFETADGLEMRLPELFCGFQRQPGEPPVAYPVACLPQAWAAGSVFMMLQACLGLTVAADHVTIVDPRLPIGIDRLWIDALQVGDQTINLAFERHDDRIVVQSNARAGLVKVLGPAI